MHKVQQHSDPEVKQTLPVGRMVNLKSKKVCPLQADTQQPYLLIFKPLLLEQKKKPKPCIISNTHHAMKCKKFIQLISYAHEIDTQSSSTHPSSPLNLLGVGWICLGHNDKAKPSHPSAAPAPGTLSLYCTETHSPCLFRYRLHYLCGENTLRPDKHLALLQY